VTAESDKLSSNAGLSAGTV